MSYNHIVIVYGGGVVQYCHCYRISLKFFSAYVSCRNQYKNAVRLFLEEIDVIQRLTEKYPDDLVFVTTAQGILDAHKANKIATLVGIEGGSLYWQ